MPTRRQGPLPSPQSCAQVEQVSPASQTPFPQHVAPSQQGPQSDGHVLQVSDPPQTPSPQFTPPPVTEALATLVVAEEEGLVLTPDVEPLPPIPTAPPLAHAVPSVAASHETTTRARRRPAVCFEVLMSDTRSSLSGCSQSKRGLTSWSWRPRPSASRLAPSDVGRPWLAAGRCRRCFAIPTKRSLIQVGDAQYAFRLTGPEKTVASRRADFDDLVASFRVK